MHRLACVSYNSLSSSPTPTYDALPQAAGVAWYDRRCSRIISSFLRYVFPVKSPTGYPCFVFHPCNCVLLSEQNDGSLFFRKKSVVPLSCRNLSLPLPALPPFVFTCPTFAFFNRCLSCVSACVCVLFGFPGAVPGGETLQCTGRPLVSKYMYT